MTRARTRSGGTRGANQRVRVVEHERAINRQRSPNRSRRPVGRSRGKTWSPLPGERPLRIPLANVCAGRPVRAGMHCTPGRLGKLAASSSSCLLASASKSPFRSAFAQSGLAVSMAPSAVSSRSRFALAHAALRTNPVSCADRRAES
jgi:hypothetical protein